MKRVPTPIIGKPPNANVEAPRQIQAAEAKRKSFWRGNIIAALAIGLVFVGLAMMEPAKGPTSPPVVSTGTPHESTFIPGQSDAEITTQTQEVERPPTTRETAPSPPTVSPQALETPQATVENEAAKLANEAILLLVGNDANRDAAKTRDVELLERTINGKAWDAYRALLERSTKDAMTKIAMGGGVNRFDPLWAEPVFYQAMLRWKILGCFSEAEISAVAADSYSAGFVLWLLNDSKAMEELLLTLHPKDDGLAVLQYLTDTWAARTDDAVFRKYYNLAIACAVVFDQSVAIPHPVGKGEYGVESTVNSMTRYQWYLDKNEKGKLAAPVHHSSARDLVWVVCAPVSTSELEWAIDKLHDSRKNWGNTYGSIEYLMERAVEGLNPYKEYSFAEILKEGGICGDQSYFSVNTARAQGIPAMSIAGETNLGGHAWAGIKIDDDEWTTRVGRINGSSKGQSNHPQTRESITEQEIQHWNDRAYHSPAITLSVFRHLWLADFLGATGNGPEQSATVHLANQLGRPFPETWKALHALLASQTQLTGDPVVPSNLEEWKTFVRDMRREYSENPRMAELAANAESEYIFPFGSEGDAKRTLLRERRRIERNSGEQKDLIGSSLKREAELILKLGGPDVKRDISRLYDRALRDYGGSITGFKMMADDYFSYFRGSDQELAQKAARDIELAFKRVVETGTKDWFRATTESEIYKMICGYYRAAGDPGRAEMLEKRYEVLLRRAKRSAI